MKLHIESQRFNFLKILKKYTNLTIPKFWCCSELTEMVCRLVELSDKAIMRNMGLII